MATERFNNNGQTTVASTYTAGATTLVVSDASKLPTLSGSDQYHIIVFDPDAPSNAEIMLVTAASGNSLTVTPATEAIAGAQVEYGHAAGETVANILSVASITAIIQQLSLSQTEADALYSVLAHTHAFADLTSKPTTLSGYGITDAQPLDATLTAFAALTIAANSLTIGTGADAFSQTAFAAGKFPARGSTGDLEAKTITDYALTLLDDADAATARSTLGATSVGQAFMTLSSNIVGPTFPRINDDNTVDKLSAADLRTAISAQSLDATLTALAGLTIAANSLSIGTGADAFSQVSFAANRFPARASTGDLEAKTITDFALTILDDADAATVRDTLLISTFFQPKDDTLTALAGMVVAANSIVRGTGTDTLEALVIPANRFLARNSADALQLWTITDFALSLLDDADASAARTTLGLGTGSLLATDTDGTLAANSDTRVPTQKAVKTYVDTAVTGLLEFKGTTDCSATPNYPSGVVGDAYIVSVAGKIGGASGKSVDVGDWYICTAINAGGTEASVGTSWSVIEHNLVGVLIASNNLSDLASAATALTNLGGTTVGKALFTLTNPDAVTFVRLNADNTVTALSAANFKAALDLEAGTDFYSIAAADAAFQPKDTDLTTWAGLTPSANFQTLVTQTFAQIRASLDLEAGTDFPALTTFEDHSARHESGGADAIKLDDLAAPDDNADLNASTSAHGLAPKATAPASGLLSVLGIGNGETVRTDKAIFDTTAPAALGTAAAGSQLVAARRDHVHTLPKLDDLAAPDDNTDLNASTSAHGLLKKLSNTATEFMNGAGNWAVPAADLGIIVLQDQKSTGTSGGTFTAGTRTRVLNTKVTDTGSDCSLASNQFTLTAGTYEILAFCPCYAVDRNQAWLQNATAGTTLVLGSSGLAYSAASAQVQHHSIISGVFTVAASQALEIQHYGQTTSATYGFGVESSSGKTEVYTTVFLRRRA